MVDVDRFFELLTEVCEELPDEFFDELHRGVLLDEGIKYSPYAENGDLVIMGQYHSSMYGNQVIIYYGSFERLYSHLDEEALKQKIREVVRHEFRHHLEFRGGIHGHDSLEHEDAVNLRRYLRNRESRKV